MASTYSPSLRLELMATGDQSGTWGDTTNTNLGTLLEQSITGYLSKAMADADQTLTNLNGASDEARNMVIEATGSLTAGRDMIVPTAEKLYLIKNSTTGGFAVTVKTSAGTGVAVAAGTAQWVYCDGTNVVQGLSGTLAAQTASAVAITGGTITGVTITGITDLAVADGGTGASTVITAHDALNTKGSDVASAGTINLTTATGAFVDITGTTTITAVTLAEGMQRMARAAGNFQITVGASLIGNGFSQNVQVKSGDLIFFEGYSGGVVRFWLTRGNGQAITPWDPRQRIVNGDMRKDQQNTGAAGTANGYYPCDQWAQYFVTSAGTLTVQQVASVTPAGSPNRLRATVTVADASLAAGEFWTLTQNLEGSNVADFQYGGSAAKNCVLRFGFKGPAGTYAVHLGNSAANRSYVALFTIAAPDANTDTVQTLAIPGDVTGTWLTADGVIGITLDIVLAAGSTFQGSTGWQAGNILATSAISNGMATGSAVFELFDVGLRLDPDATGVYGQYEVGETDAVYRSERYIATISGVGIGNTSTARVNGGGLYIFPVQLAKTPTIISASFTVSAGSAGTVAFDTAGGATASSKAVNFYNSASNWTTSQNASVTAVLSARLS